MNGIAFRDMLSYNLEDPGVRAGIRSKHMASSSSSKLKIKEIQVECIKPTGIGDDTELINLMLTVVRGPRGRRKLFGEAFTRQIYQPFIHFKVYDDGDVDVLFQRFLGQLVHRGYKPLTYRKMDLEDRWAEWHECDLSNIDTSSLERAGDADTAFDESGAANTPPRD